MLISMDRKLDMLSEQLTKGFDSLGLALDTVSSQVIGQLIKGEEGALEVSKGMAELNKALEEQKRKKSIDGNKFSEMVAKIIEEKMSGVSEGLREQIKKSLDDVLFKSESDQLSMHKKIDAVLGMTKSMQEKMDTFMSDFKAFNDISLQHYSAVSKKDNIMPSSFLLLPHAETPLLDSKASIGAKAINWGKRQKNKVVKLGWNQVRVVFICPVTLQKVDCKEYVLSSATDNLRQLAVAIKWGHFLIK